MPELKEPILDEFAGFLRASTIIPIRQSQGGMEVLLVKRHENIDFAGGAYVFPGGQHFEGDKNLINGEHNTIDIAKVAAIREAFEETGFLIAYDKNNNLVGGKTCYNELRQKINHEPSHFIEFMEKNNFSPALDLLVPVSIWVPPEYASKRYLTWFFIIELPYHAKIIPDGKEIIEYIWQGANTALKRIEGGEINALFPTSANLSFISGYDNFDQIKEFLNCKNMPLIRTKTIDKGINLWVETDVRDFYSYSTKQFH